MPQHSLNLDEAFRLQDLEPKALQADGQQAAGITGFVYEKYGFEDFHGRLPKGKSNPYLKGTSGFFAKQS